MKETIKMLKELTDANGVPGNEGEVRQVMKKYLENVADDIYTDNLGSFIAKRSTISTLAEVPCKIMIAGHMDEVGFIVKLIDDNGFIKFQTMGGWVSHTLLAQQVVITTSENKKIRGVIGAKPPHLMNGGEREKALDVEKMFIDIGVESKKKAEKLGIQIGDMITPYIEFKRMANPKYLLAKAWDNRAGCGVAIDVMKNLTDYYGTIYAVGTVQEEVGLRGAITSANKIEPDIAFVVDVGLAGDMPGVSEVDGKLGKGPQIVIMDSMTIAHKKLKDFVVEVAKELKIPYQLEIMTKGGTDAGRIHMSGSGVPTVGIALASRYIHSHTFMIHLDDYLNTVKLLTEVIKNLTKEKVLELTKQI